jgi:phosphoserine phosphatase
MNELLERLERERAASAEPLAVACDADGTLWRGDIGEELFHAAIRERGLREPAREALAREAEAHDIAAGGDSHDLAMRLYDAYRQDRYPEGRAFAMMAWCFAGWRPAELRAFASDVLDAFEFETAVRHEARALIAWAKDKVAVWLVSASPELIMLEAAERLGVPARCVVAMKVAERDGVLEPDLALPASYAEGKLMRLRERTDHALLAAFGDTAYDLALLRAARVPVAVHPQESLKRALSTLPRVVVVGG